MQRTAVLSALVAAVTSAGAGLASDDVRPQSQMVVEVLSQGKVFSSLSFDRNEPPQFTLNTGRGPSADAVTLSFTYPGKAMVLTGQRIRIRDGDSVIDTN